MREPARPIDGALLGLAAAMRCFAPPGMLALLGGVAGRQRALLLVLAGGELAWDKAPFATARTRREAHTARVISAGVTGGRVGGPAVALTAAATAAAATHACYEARRRLRATTGWSDLPVAIAEDAIALTAAYSALTSSP